MTAVEEGGGGYWNTTRLSGDQLRACVATAGKQEDFILALYKACKAALSPSDVWQLCELAGKSWPLTSVRRAITSLTQSGALTQTGALSLGMYGKPEHRWELMDRTA